MVTISASRWALVAHASTVLLTTVMLIFAGVSGPATKYWTFRIVYADSAHSSDILTRGQEEWLVGGLGSCQDGDSGCPAHQLPGYVKHLRGVPLLALATAVIFTLFATVNAWLIYLPPKSPAGRVRAAWWTLFLPFVPWLFVFLALIVGLAVKQDISSRDGVESVSAEPSFWLLAAAIAFATLYLIAVQWVRWRVLRGMDTDQESGSRSGRKGKEVVQMYRKGPATWGEWVKSWSPWRRPPKSP